MDILPSNVGTERRRQTPELLTALRQAAVIESSESSNRLEGITAPHEHIAAMVLKNTPRDRSEREIAGYWDALNLVHEPGRDMPFSVNAILQLHKILYGYLPTRAPSFSLTASHSPLHTRRSMRRPIRW